MNFKSFANKMAARRPSHIKRSPIRSSRYRQLHRNRAEHDSGDLFTTQISVCVILIVFVMGISRIDSDVTRSLSESLKYAISNHTSVEVMKNTAKESVFKAGSLTDKIKAFLGIQDKNDEETTVDSLELNTEDFQEEISAELFPLEQDDIGEITESLTTEVPLEDVTDVDSIMPIYDEGEILSGKGEAPIITPEQL